MISTSQQLTLPSIVDALELQSVYQEVITDDIYRFRSLVEPDETWVDLGVHIGLSSIMIDDCGGKILACVDADRNMLIAAQHNTVHLAPSPQFIQQKIVEGADVTNILERLDQRTNGLKMDIQGAEVDFCDHQFLQHLTRLGINKLVLEWHDPQQLNFLYQELEHANYQIEYQLETVDTLLGIPTTILIARNK